MLMATLPGDQSPSPAGGARSRGRLPDEVIQQLLPFVDEASLRSFRARESPPWRWVPVLLRAGATTLGPNVCFRAGRYRVDTPGGLALIAHEAVHICQYRDLGWPRFLTRYLREAVRVRFSHAAHPMEQEALHVQAAVRAALSAEQGT